MAKYNDILAYLYANAEYIFEKNSKNKMTAALPDYDETNEFFINSYDGSKVTRSQYNKAVKELNHIFYAVTYYNTGLEVLIQLSDNHTLWNFPTEAKYIPENKFSVYEFSVYDNVLSDAEAMFKERTGETAYFVGRSGRHICVDDNLDNALRYDELCKVQQELEKKVLEDIKNIGILFEKARKYIERYMQREFENNDVFEFPDDISDINLAYTDTEDELFEITADLDLVNFKIDTKVDGTVVKTEQYESLEDIVENGLASLEFNELVYVPEYKLTPFYIEKCLPEEIKLVLNMELKDDNTPFGGKTYSDETVKDFIWEAYENDEIKKLTFERLNRDLQKNGILPINKTDLLPEEIKSLLNYTLKDIEDEPFEGTLFNGETLKYFLEFHDIEDILKMKTLDDLNRDLTFSGLMPISLDKEFTVTFKVQGRYITTVMAKNLAEAKERAMNNWIEADIGDIEETNGTIVAIDDAMDNRVFEDLN